MFAKIIAKCIFTFKAISFVVPEQVQYFCCFVDLFFTCTRRVPIIYEYCFNWSYTKSKSLLVSLNSKSKQLVRHSFLNPSIASVQYQLLIFTSVLHNQHMVTISVKKYSPLTSGSQLLLRSQRVLFVQMQFYNCRDTTVEQKHRPQRWDGHSTTLDRKAELLL